MCLWFSIIGNSLAIWVTGFNNCATNTNFCVSEITKKCNKTFWCHEVPNQLNKQTHIKLTTRWQQLTNHLCNCFLILCNYFPVKIRIESPQFVNFVSLNCWYFFLQARLRRNSEASYLISKTSVLLSSYFLFHSLTSISLVMIWLEDRRRREKY